MKKFLILGLMASAAVPASASAYLPTGVQTNVATSTVTSGGWTQCYSETYGTYGTSLASILAGCNAGSSLMMAARAVGSSTLLVLAQAPTVDVTFDTGTGNVTHNANGVEWYYNSSYSWGFAPNGASVYRTSCDINGSAWTSIDATTPQRLCWHTSGGQMDGGWRAGEFINLNGSADYEKVLYTYTGTPAVPEPTTWAMMIAGMAVVGSSMRRRKTAVSFA